MIISSEALICDVIRSGSGVAHPSGGFVPHQWFVSMSFDDPILTGSEVKIDWIRDVETQTLVDLDLYSSSLTTSSYTASIT